jgi:pyruvate/2-oxoacid:ferredoxin oxidoreductase beta subunit
VGPGHGNKRHRVAIELTTGCLAVVAGSGCAPATAHGGGRRRAHGGSGCCGVEVKLGQTSARVSFPGC